MNPAPPALTRGKILVIDDDPIIQRTIFFVLRDQGYTVLMSGEISEALIVVRKERPDLILLDLNFPPESSLVGGVRDGFWALEWMQHMEEIKGVPIVIISMNDPAVAGQRARAAGAAAYLHKPVGKDELVLTVAELLAQKKSVPPPSA